MPTAIPVTCPNCDAAIGEMVQVNGRVKLDSAGWLIADGIKHCHRCGRPFHFKPPMANWEELVERYQKVQNGRVPDRQRLPA